MKHLRMLQSATLSVSVVFFALTIGLCVVHASYDPVQYHVDLSSEHEIQVEKNERLASGQVELKTKVETLSNNQERLISQVSDLNREMGKIEGIGAGFGFILTLLHIFQLTKRKER